MRQHQLNVHYTGNQYSAALIKNQGNMSWFAHVVFQLRKCTCWLMWKKILIKGRFHCFLHPEAGPGDGNRVIKPSVIRAPFQLHNTLRPLLLRQRAEIKAVSTGDSPGRFSGSLLWCSSCHHHHHQRHQRHACPSTRSHKPGPKKNLASPRPSPSSPSPSSCLNAHIHSHTLRQSPLGIMIMKEMQCVAAGGVCAARRLWC